VGRNALINKEKVLRLCRGIPTGILRAAVALALPARADEAAQALPDLKRLSLEEPVGP
jgi:hypothetical protein